MSSPAPYDDAPTLPEEGPLDLRGLFVPPAARLELEVGPGRGGFVFERLQSAPLVSLVGIEIRRKWASILDARLGARGLAGRARIFSGDIRAILPRVPSGSVSAIFVHFPDPWWKKRHRKRLVVTHQFVVEAARVLEEGGEIFLQTDVAERAEQYRALFAAEPRFRAGGVEPLLSENPYAARSPRERRAEADGLPVYRLLFRRVGSPGT